MEAWLESGTNLETGHVETAWSDALSNSQGDGSPLVLAKQEGMILQRCQQPVRAPVPTIYRALSRLGGATGWLRMD
jgi:hypothetical protein